MYAISNDGIKIHQNKQGTIRIVVDDVKCLNMLVGIKPEKTDYLFS